MPCGASPRRRRRCWRPPSPGRTGRPRPRPAARASRGAGPPPGPPAPFTTGARTRRARAGRALPGSRLRAPEIDPTGTVPGGLPVGHRQAHAGVPCRPRGPRHHGPGHGDPRALHRPRRATAIRAGPAAREPPVCRHAGGRPLQGGRKRQRDSRRLPAVPRLCQWAVSDSNARSTVPETDRWRKSDNFRGRPVPGPLHVCVAAIAGAGAGSIRARGCPSGGRPRSRRPVPIARDSPGPLDSAAARRRALAVLRGGQGGRRRAPAGPGRRLHTAQIASAATSTRTLLPTRSTLMTRTSRFLNRIS